MSVGVRLFGGKRMNQIDVYSTGFGDAERCVVVAKANPRGALSTIMRMSPDEAEHMAEQLKAAAADGRRRHEREEQWRREALG